MLVKSSSSGKNSEFRLVRYQRRILLLKSKVSPTEQYYMSSVAASLFSWEVQVVESVILFFHQNEFSSNGLYYIFLPYNEFCIIHLLMVFLPGLFWSILINDQLIQLFCLISSLEVQKSCMRYFLFI